MPHKGHQSYAGAAKQHRALSRDCCTPGFVVQHSAFARERTTVVHVYFNFTIVLEVQKLREQKKENVHVSRVRYITLPIMGKVTPYCLSTKLTISPHVPGSWAPNWLDGNAMIASSSSS